MTSVRVRRRGYSTIRDAPVTPTIPSPSAQPGPSDSVSRAQTLPHRPRAQSDAVLQLDTGNRLRRPSHDSDDVFQTPVTPRPDLNVPPSPSTSKVIRHVQSRSSRGSFKASSSNRPRAGSLRPPLTTVFSQSGQQPSSPSERGQLTTSPEPLAISPASGSPNLRQRQVNERGDVVLEGAQEDVIIPGEGIPMGRVGSALSHHTGSVGEEGSVFADHHDDDIVEHLDVVDPHVATVSALANTANAIMIPPISFYSRKPVVVLGTFKGGRDAEAGVDSAEDELDRHVEDVLTRRMKFRRIMSGVWSFLKTPMGVAVGIYGFLVVFWGAAIVIFLIKIINFHNANTQGLWVEISSQVENGLFCVTGLGLIPWRVKDSYRVIRIWFHKRRTRKLRAKAGLLPLLDPDDLPDPMYDVNYVHVLSEKEQADLHKQQQKFMKSQTWYRPHGTETHRAFPINTALLICLLNDGNSVFQIILCGTMWGLDRFQRPAWSTGILIPLSFLCGIGSGVFIWRGGAKTKRTESVEERLRQALKMDDGDDHPDDEGPTTNVGSPTTTPNPYGHVNSRGSVHEGNGNGSVASPLLGPSLQRKQRQDHSGSVNGGGSSMLEKRRTDDEETERESRDEEKFDRGSDSSVPGVVVEIDEEMEVPADELGDSRSNASDHYLSVRKKGE